MPPTRHLLSIGPPPRALSRRTGPPGRRAARAVSVVSRAISAALRRRSAPSRLCSAGKSTSSARQRVSSCASPRHLRRGARLLQGGAGDLGRLAHHLGPFPPGFRRHAPPRFGAFRHGLPPVRRPLPRWRRLRSQPCGFARKVRGHVLAFFAGGELGPTPGWRRWHAGGHCMPRVRSRSAPDWRRYRVHA